VLAVADVDAAIATTEREGGSVISPAEDYPDADVRATIVSDPQGHIVEFVGPIPPR
jgi:predicted enzyme related to lactoylglutathione lyase